MLCHEIIVYYFMLSLWMMSCHHVIAYHGVVYHIMLSQYIISCAMVHHILAYCILYHFNIMSIIVYRILLSPHIVPFFRHVIIVLSWQSANPNKGATGYWQTGEQPEIVISSFCRLPLSVAYYIVMGWCTMLCYLGLFITSYSMSRHVIIYITLCNLCMLYHCLWRTIWSYYVML